MGHIKKIVEVEVLLILFVYWSIILLEKGRSLIPQKTTMVSKKKKQQWWAKKKNNNGELKNKQQWGAKKQQWWVSPTKMVSLSHPTHKKQQWQVINREKVVKGKRR